jgi:hypothetical protein
LQRLPYKRETPKRQDFSGQSDICLQAQTFYGDGHGFAAQTIQRKLIYSICLHLFSSVVPTVFIVRRGPMKNI